MTRSHLIDIRILCGVISQMKRVNERVAWIGSTLILNMPCGETWTIPHNATWVKIHGEGYTRYVKASEFGNV